MRKEEKNEENVSKWKHYGWETGIPKQSGIYWMSQFQDGQDFPDMHVVRVEVESGAETARIVLHTTRKPIEVRKDARFRFLQPTGE